MATSLPSPNNTDIVTAPTVSAPGQEYWYQVHDCGIVFLLALVLLIIITTVIVGLIICLVWDIYSTASKKVSPPGPVNARRLVAPDAGVKQNNCTICLSEFQNGECIRALPRCKYTHRFHVACMDILLKDHNKCTDCHTLTAEPIGKGKAIEEP